MSFTSPLPHQAFPPPPGCPQASDSDHDEDEMDEDNDDKHEAIGANDDEDEEQNCLPASFPPRAFPQERTSHLPPSFPFPPWWKRKWTPCLLNQPRERWRCQAAVSPVKDQDQGSRIKEPYHLLHSQGKSLNGGSLHLLPPNFGLTRLDF